MKREYFKPEIRCLFVGGDCLMDNSVRVNNKEAGDDWQGAKGNNTFFEEYSEACKRSRSISVWN